MNTVDAFLKELNLDPYGVRGPLTSLVLTPRFPASRHVVFLLIPLGRTDPVLVAKVPRLPEVSDSVQRETAVLRAIQSLRPDGFDTLPRVVAFERYRGIPILVETALAGSLLSPAVMRRAPDAHIRAVIAWLVDMHQIATPGSDWYATLVDAPIRHLEAVLPEDDQPLLNRLRRIVQPLEHAALPFVVEHGDLGHPNLIRLRTGKIGVVDWELAQVAGMIASDLFFFLSYAAFSLNRANETGVYLPVFEQAFFGKSAWAIPYIHAYLEQVALPAGLLGPLFALTWTRYLSNLLMRLSEGESEPMSAAVHTQMRSNRYHGLWRYTVTHIDELAFT